MSRISQVLSQTKANGRKALVAYIVNGDPYPTATLPTMHKLVEQGVDVIELGVPFSDPMAEGPVIQKGHERALAHNISLRNTLEVAREPVLLAQILSNKPFVKNYPKVSSAVSFCWSMEL